MGEAAEAAMVEAEAINPFTRTDNAQRLIQRKRSF